MKDYIYTMGITVNYNDGWFAECDWRYGGFGEDCSMDGKIYTSYSNLKLETAIDNILNTMKKMNIKRSDEIDELKVLGFYLYRNEKEKQTKECLEQIKNEADKRGWGILFSSKKER